MANGGPLPPGLRDACAREPVAFGAAVDEMIVDRRQFAVRTDRTAAGLAGRRPGSAGERSAGDGADHPAVHPRRSRRPRPTGRTAAASPVLDQDRRATPTSARDSPHCSRWPTTRSGRSGRGPGREQLLAGDLPAGRLPCLSRADAGAPSCAVCASTSAGDGHGRARSGSDGGARGLRAPDVSGAERGVQGGSPPVAQNSSVTVLGICATALLRAELSAFLDGAGRRRDVRVSVGVAGPPGVEWVLRDVVPFGVRALPRYPADGGDGVREHPAGGAAGGRAGRAPAARRGLGNRAPADSPGLARSPRSWWCTASTGWSSRRSCGCSPGRDAQIVLSRTAPGARPGLLGALRPVADQLGRVPGRAAWAGADAAGACSFDGLTNTARPRGFKGVAPLRTTQSTVVGSRSASRRARPGRGRSEAVRRARPRVRPGGRRAGCVSWSAAMATRRPRPNIAIRCPEPTKTSRSRNSSRLSRREAADRGAGEAYAGAGRGLGPESLAAPARRRSSRARPAGRRADPLRLPTMRYWVRSRLSTRTPAGSQPQRPGPDPGPRATVPSGCSARSIGGRPGATRNAGVGRATSAGDEDGRSGQVVQILVVPDGLVGRPADVVRSRQVACLVRPVPCRPVQLRLPAEPVELAGQLQRPVGRFRLVAPLAVLRQQHVPGIARAGPIVDPLALGHRRRL